MHIPHKYTPGKAISRGNSEHVVESDPSCTFVRELKVGNLARFCTTRATVWQLAASVKGYLNTRLTTKYRTWLFS